MVVPTTMLVIVRVNPERIPIYINLNVLTDTFQKGRHLKKNSRLRIPSSYRYKSATKYESVTGCNYPLRGQKSSLNEAGFYYRSRRSVTP